MHRFFKLNPVLNRQVRGDVLKDFKIVRAIRGVHLEISLRPVISGLYEKTVRLLLIKIRPSLFTIPSALWGIVNTASFKNFVVFRSVLLCSKTI